MAKNITLYSTPTCPFCKMTRNYFEEHGIKYKDIDVSVSEEAQKEMIEKSGTMSVPVIDIDGKIITGFNEEEITKALKG